MVKAGQVWENRHIKCPLEFAFYFSTFDKKIGTERGFVCFVFVF